MTFYLQFGKAGEPMQTVSVEHKEKPLPFHLAGLSYTATGYGSKIPTVYMVKLNNRWHRVYVAVFSNVGSAYILVNGERVTVSSEAW